jgi:uncharacterized coiled-coil protein SlyX
VVPASPFVTTGFARQEQELVGLRSVIADQQQKIASLQAIINDHRQVKDLNERLTVLERTLASRRQKKIKAD